MSKNKILVLTVILILIMNIALLVKIGDLNDEIEKLSHNYNNLHTSINSVSSNINQSLDRFTREQSWITPVQINNEKSLVENNQGLAVMNWQVKDFKEGSEVIFHYRMSESEEFKAVPAVKQDTGLFEVQIPINIKEEPLWEIQNIRVDEKGKNQNEAYQVATEIKQISQEDQTISCYISMKTKDTVKSSEIVNHNIGYLAYYKYEPIRGDLQVNSNQYNLSLFEDQSGNNSIESVMASFYSGNNLLAEKQLDVENPQNGMQGIKHRFLHYDSGKESISNIVLQVKYQNGKSFSKEIL